MSTSFGCRSNIRPKVGSGWKFQSSGPPTGGGRNVYEHNHAPRVEFRCVNENFVALCNRARRGEHDQHVRIAFVMLALVLGAWRHPPPVQDWFLIDVDWRRGSAELSSSSAAALDEVARAIKDHPEWRQIGIGGHGDRGSRARREKLGVRRALAFVDALVARGVEPERLRVVMPTYDPRTDGRLIEINVLER